MELYFGHDTVNVDPLIEKVLNCDRYAELFNKIGVLMASTNARQFLQHKNKFYQVKQPFMEWIDSFGETKISNKIKEIIVWQK